MTDPKPSPGAVRAAVRIGDEVGYELSDGTLQQCVDVAASLIQREAVEPEVAALREELEDERVQHECWHATARRLQAVVEAARTLRSRMRLVTLHAIDGAALAQMTQAEDELTKCLAALDTPPPPTMETNNEV